MVCNSRILEAFLKVGQCFLLMVGATFYRVVLFIIFLSASVGPATLLCYIYVLITGREPYPEVQPAISMMLLSCWADFSIGIERRLCGGMLDHFKSVFPNAMSFGRFFLHFTMYIVAFCELYLEFEKVHTIPEFQRNHHFFRRRFYVVEDITKIEEREALAKRNEQYHVTTFLFALAYLVFITSRNFHKDLLLVVRNFSSVTFSMLNNWLFRLGFAVIHAVVNLVYFLPCLAIAYTANNYKTAGLTMYFQLTFTAGMAGMIAALFELNRPWPQRRGRMPFLPHENNIFGKNLLAHVLVVGILYFFYRPKIHAKVLESRFDSTNHDVICFSLMVAFTTLHIVKFGVHAVLSLAHEYDQRVHEINHVNVVMPEIGGGVQDSRNDSHHHQCGGGGGGLGSNGVNGEMCNRCIANMLNNNAPLPHPAPNVNQEHINGCVSSQPEESTQERSQQNTAANSEDSERESGGANKNDDTATSTYDNMENSQGPSGTSNMESADLKDCCVADGSNKNTSALETSKLWDSRSVKDLAVDLEIVNETA